MNTPTMLKFAANLSWLYTELPFLDRFAAAARDRFTAVECQFPYAFAPAEVAARLAEIRASDGSEHDYAEGSMGPKVRAARQFALATGRDALIGALDEVSSVLAGASGTRVTR